MCCGRAAPLSALIDPKGQNLSVIVSFAAGDRRSVKCISIRGKNFKKLSSIADKNNLRTYSQVSSFRVCPNSERGQSWRNVKRSHERDSKDGWNRGRNDQTELVRQRIASVRRRPLARARRQHSIEHRRAQAAQCRGLDERRGDLRYPPSRETHRGGIGNPSHYPGRYPSLRRDQYS